MKSVFVFICLILLFVGHEFYPNKKSLNLTEFLRLRCSTNPDEEVITTWKGSVYLQIYQNTNEHLFDLIGMNIARCLMNRERNEMILTSRECQLYLDKNNGKKLIHWINPFTKQNLSVVHVANDPVQNSFPIDQFRIDGWMNNQDDFVLPIDVNLFYRNPLFDNETLRYYSKEEFYQAGEYFKFFSSYQQIQNERLTQVNQLGISWTRQSPFLPWMNMSQLFNGSLIFSAQGTKLKQIEDLDSILFNEILHRLPLYLHSPSCQLNSTSETSWTYFRKYFSFYLSHQEEFPLPQFNETIPCQSSISITSSPSNSTTK